MGKNSKSSYHSRTNVTFGSLSLKQYESVVNSDVQKNMLTGECNSRRGHESPQNRDGDEDMLMRMQLAKDVPARQAAQLAVEEKGRKWKL